MVSTLLNNSTISVSIAHKKGLAVARAAIGKAIGVDVEDEESALKVWYSDDDDKIRLRSTFTIGTQVAYQEEIAAIVL